MFPFMNVFVLAGVAVLFDQQFHFRVPSIRWPGDDSVTLI